MICANKVKYLTFVDAKIACETTLVKRGIKLSPYTCEECGMYHLTKLKLSWVKHSKKIGTWKKKKTLV